MMYVFVFLSGCITGVLATVLIFLRDYSKVIKDQRLASEKVLR